jgi:hypothetical protein
MSEADGTIPTTVTRKRKRKYGFRYSSKKALQRSRLSKEKSKDGVLELGSMRKALTYPSELLSKIGVVSLVGCSSGSFGLASLQSVDENPEERIDASTRNGFLDVEFSNKVRISSYVLICLILILFHLLTIVIIDVT